MSKASLYFTYSKFLKETDWLMTSCATSLLGIALHDSNERIFRLLGEMTVVRLHDAWARFCRELIIMSAGSKPYTASNKRLKLAPGITKSGDVIPVLLSTYKKTNYEPKWYRSVDCINAANNLKIQNLSTVAAAIGSTSSPSEELRHVRNFFVHRGKNTANKICNFPSLSHISSLNLESLAGDKMLPGITRMEHWVIGLRLVARASIQ